MSRVKPTYQEKLRIVNKITIAPHKANELTILLEDYKGPEGWIKDARIISYGVKLQEWGELGYSTMLAKLASDPEFLEVADIAFNGKIDLSNYGFMDVVTAFQEAIQYRMGQADTEEITEAKKN